MNFTDPFGLCGLPGAALSVGIGAALGIATGGYSLAAAAFDAGSGAACVGVLAKLGKVGGSARRALAQASTTVYRSVDGAGSVQYVGITNNLARRAAEHLADKGIQIEKVMGGLSRTDARAVEQTLIQVHGLSRNGGTLMNRINSIAETNPSYAGQLRRGMELLERHGYK